MKFLRNAEETGLTSTLDFRMDRDPRNSWVILCNSCGIKTLVNTEHGKYCPVCGPNVLTPVTAERFKKIIKKE